MELCNAKQSRGAIADFVCFHCLLVAPIWRDTAQLLGRAAWGGASEDAQSYWQGRFAACALVDFFL